ncbi:MAG: DUF4411 family protein [Clostridiales bacterium]|nr:DUF4411 family protein [Clostridiales bacterium]
MVITSDKFLIDANTLMTAARLYYAYDLAPSFWEAFGEKIEEGNIILLDMVKNEIDKGQDELKAWVDERQGDFKICNHVDSEIIPQYVKVMQYIQECGFYNEKGLNSWAKDDVADPWLIATAAAKDYCLITFEQSAGSLSTKNKSGKVKIPDVASHFGVKVYTLYYMMRQLGIKI